VAQRKWSREIHDRLVPILVFLVNLEGGTFHNQLSLSELPTGPTDPLLRRLTTHAHRIQHTLLLPDKRALLLRSTRAPPFFLGSGDVSWRHRQHKVRVLHGVEGRARRCEGKSEARQVYTCMLTEGWRGSSTQSTMMATRRGSHWE
jgi:hypothetical protein